MRRIEKSWKKSTWCASVMMLLFFFSSQFLPLVLASVPAQELLPVCCRVHGEHHCVMNKDLFIHYQGSHSPQMTRIGEKCPFSAATPIGLHGHDFRADVCYSIFAELVSGSLLMPQRGTRRRSSFDRTRPTRGPPLIFLDLLF